ncbi:MAG: 4Fe-4S dicluster domain-containing protein [Candidatus Eisenbacteria sp.]|nr:4Fe-4S dicluster domain-containing protein [Candidatus Eisenbacteria bacterium]
MNRSTHRESQKGLLIDFTKCIGCEACMEGCREANDLAQPSPGDPPARELGADNFTVVVPREVDGKEVFIRRLCMHCADPACVSACPVGALTKRPDGAVSYDGDLCFGCRYCMVACPFSVPRYQWDSNAPVVRKCTLCYPRLDEGQEPACAAACPTGATRFGPRETLLEIARERIRKHPDLYVDHIFGEKEVGGGSILMISPVDFAQLGFPASMTHNPLPELTWAVQKRIPSIVVTGTVFLGGLYWVVNRRMERARDAEDAREVEDARGAER